MPGPLAPPAAVAAHNGPTHLTLPVDASQFRVEAGAPRVIRITGFGEILNRFPHHLDKATCVFGVNNVVPCRCDPIEGTVECDVPHEEVACWTPDAGGTLRVKVCIADFETPSLIVRYNTCPFADHIVPKSAEDKGESDVDQNQSSWHAQKKTLQGKALALLKRENYRNKKSKLYSLLHQCIAESLGTMLIVVFGVGAVCSATLTDVSSGLWQVATVWGFGIALAICATASVSGGHLNPAVSLAMALFRPHEFPARKLLAYWAAQYIGGLLGGAFNLLLFGPLYRRFERVNNFVRGDESSLLSAKTFGAYFPDPGLVGGDGGFSADLVSSAFALLIEAWGTAVFVFMIFALKDPRQKIIRNQEMVPFYIGFTFAVLFTLYAPLTQVALNPARDFGPRLVAAMAGWGKVAIPGPKNGFWVYIIAPKIGGVVGAFVYEVLVNPGLAD